jgi:Caspase domain
MEASMLKHLTACLFSFAVLLGTLAGAAAEKRVALVIGNSAYQHTPALRNPSNDATDIAEKLRGLGFKVIDGTDLSKADMEERIRSFAAELTGADVGLFFYAGHGLQVDGRNLLVPVDAQLKSDTDIDFEAVDANLVLKQLERNSRISIVFLDACRDNPMAANLAQSRSVEVNRGLARIDKAVGMMVAFSTQPGNVALDGQGRNSPFTEALLQHISDQGASINDLMIEVRNDVLKSTDGKQVPWENSSLTGQFYFNPAAPKTSEDKTNETGAQIAALREEINRLQTNQGALLTVQQEQLALLQEKLQHETVSAVQSGIPVPSPHPAETNRIIAVEPAGAAPTPAPTPEALKIAAAETPGPEGKQPESAKPTKAPLPEGVTREQLATDIISELKDLDCYRGRINGKWGDRSQGALDQFNAVSKLDLPLDEPAPATLDAIKGWKGAHCESEQAVIPHLAPQLHHRPAPQQVVIPHAAPPSTRYKADVQKRAPYHPNATAARPAPHAKPQGHASDELNELQRQFPQTYRPSQ